MAGGPAPNHCNLAPPAKGEATRQRAILARLIAAIEPDNSELIANRLLDEFRSLGRIWAASPEALYRFLGRGSAVVSLIVGAREAALETMEGDLRGIAIDPFSPALRRYLIASMGSLSDEVLRVLFLDESRRLIADEQLQRGTLAQMAVYPRTIFRRALEHNAAGIILVHNHPSGDPTPSAEDIEATRRLDQIGRSLDIAVVDHIVVTSAYAHHIVNRDALAGAPPETSSYTFRSRRTGSLDASVDAAYENAKAAMRRRLLRQQLFGAPELFGDPAWEMLVDLFVHECERKRLSISALCVTSSIPMSSALRLAQRLCDAGLTRRVPDPIDGRRTFIRLDPVIAHRIRAYFEAGAE